jgi:hypothetical protein
MIGVTFLLESMPAKFYKFRHDNQSWAKYQYVMHIQSAYASKHMLAEM